MYLDLGADEVAVEELPVLDEVELADLLARLGVVHLARLLATLLLERHLAKVSDGRGQLEGVSLDEVDFSKYLLLSIQLPSLRG